MFKNEVTLLKKENATQLDLLKVDTQIVIGGIAKSLSVFRINSYAAHVILRDLIGMTQEMELRGSSLEKEVGDDLKNFVGEIIDNSEGPSKMEILLGFLIKLSGLFFLSLGLLSIGAYSGLTWKISSIMFLLYFGTALISFVSEGLITPLYSIDRGIKKHIPTIISMILVMVLIMVVLQLNDYAGTTNISAATVLFISGAAYVILNYLNVKNIERLSRGRKNHTADLIRK